MSELHKDPWMMARIASALDAIHHAEHAGLEVELDLLAFAEDVIAREREQIATEIERERDHPGRGWNDYNPDGVSQASHKILTGIKEGLTAAVNVVRRTHVTRDA